MSDDEILAKLSSILGSLLGNDAIRLTSETERADVPGWDSFAYVNFIVAVEIEFGLRFQVADVESFKNVGEIVAAIKAR